MPLEIVIRPSMESSFPIYIIFIRQPWYYNLTTERRDESSFSLLNFRYVLLRWKSATEVGENGGKFKGNDRSSFASAITHVEA